MKKHVGVLLAITGIGVSGVLFAEPPIVAAPTHKPSSTKPGKAMPTPPIACSLTAAEFQKRRVEVLQKLKGHIKERRELSNGYALRFDADNQRLEDVMQFIRLERTCCSFLTLKFGYLSQRCLAT